jgi:RNA polymerase sigma-70 factor, ECF subfamily
MRYERAEIPAELETQQIRQIAKGDRSAFEAFYQTHQNRLFHYLFSIVHATEAAEELTNDVMLEVWKGAARFRGQSKPSTWLFGIAHHKALNELRRRRPRLEELRSIRHMADPAPGPEALSVREGARGSVDRALASLSPEHREVVELTFYHQCSYQEIAQIVGCPVNTVKTRMFYAKQRMRRELAGQDVGSEPA